jgi:hypothetical protein
VALAQRECSVDAALAERAHSIDYCRSKYGEHQRLPFWRHHPLPSRSRRIRRATAAPTARCKVAAASSASSRRARASRRCLPHLLRSYCAFAALITLGAVGDVRVGTHAVLTAEPLCACIYVAYARVLYAAHGFRPHTAWHLAEAVDVEGDVRVAMAREPDATFVLNRAALRRARGGIKCYRLAHLSRSAKVSTCLATLTTFVSQRRASQHLKLFLNILLLTRRARSQPAARGALAGAAPVARGARRAPLAAAPLRPAPPATSTLKRRVKLRFVAQVDVEHDT